MEMWTDEAANAFSQVNERNRDVSPIDKAAL
jgi:hypothetical protein